MTSKKIKEFPVDTNIRISSAAFDRFGEAAVSVASGKLIFKLMLDGCVRYYSG
jgi:hypothetical protein